MQQIIPQQRIKDEIKVTKLLAASLFWINAPDDGTSRYAGQRSRAAQAYVDAAAEYSANYRTFFGRIPTLRDNDILRGMLDEEIEAAIRDWYAGSIELAGQRVDEMDDAAGNIPAWLEEVI